MSYDFHKCLRGACLACGECPSFISLSGKILCDYCGCPPTRHTKLDDDNTITKEHDKSPNPTSEEVAVTKPNFKDLRGQISNQSSVHPPVTRRNAKSDIRSYFHPRGRNAKTDKDLRGQTSSQSSLPPLVTRMTDKELRGQTSSQSSLPPQVTRMTDKDIHDLFFNQRNSKADWERAKTRNSGRGKLGTDRSSGEIKNNKSSLNKVKAGRNSMVSKRPAVSKRRMPRRLDLLLDLPEVKLGWKDQAKHGWNDADRSHNLYLNDNNKMTVHRRPVAASTDGIRTLTPYEKGLHVFELTWSSELRGTHAVVGVGTAEAPIHTNGYKSLVGSDANSWGWDLGRMGKSKAYHNKNGTKYPAFLPPAASFKVPDKFLMILDMDEGTLAFAVDDQHLGVAHTGLKGKKVFPMVSAVWGRCEISIKYVGGMDSQPLPLLDLCSQAVRRVLGTKLDEKSLAKLKLPKTLVKCIGLNDKDMVQHFKDKNMIFQA